MSVPKLSYHKATRRFFIWANRKRVYLGRGADPAKPSLEIEAAYREALCRVLGDESPRPDLVPETLTIAELAAQYLEHAQRVYGPGELRAIGPPLKHLARCCGVVEALKFGPRKLADFQQYLVDLGHCRQGINKTVQTVRRLFKWAVSRELLPAASLQALACLEPLRFGRTSAPEAPERPPVADDHIRAVLPYLGPRVGAMVSLQRLTGMRPSEVCRLSMEEIDRSTPKRWVYAPTRHKNLHRGKKRLVPIIGKALEILLPWVRADGKPLFSPLEEVAERAVGMRERRKTKVQPSQMNRGKDDRQRPPGDQYDTRSYGKAIQRACIKAGIPAWSPNALRKTRAQEVADLLGIDAARALLGHASKEVTERFYARQDLAKAIEAVQALEAMG